MMLLNTEHRRPLTPHFARSYPSIKNLKQSAIHEVFLSSHCSEEDREHFDELIIHKARISKGLQLYRAGEPSQYLYFVRRGSFKTTLVSEQGHSLVTGFTMSGEPMGLEVITGELHMCTATALEDSEVNLISCQCLANLARDIPVLQFNLNRMLSSELIRSQNMLITLGYCNAEVRLAIFMLNLSRRFAVRGYSAHSFLLRMSREDIASSIGVRAETICRAIARLRTLRLMTFEGRSVEIIDIPLLETFCQRG